MLHRRLQNTLYILCPLLNIYVRVLYLFPLRFPLSTKLHVQFYEQLYIIVIRVSPRAEPIVDSRNRGVSRTRATMDPSVPSKFLFLHVAQCFEYSGKSITSTPINFRAKEILILFHEEHKSSSVAVSINKYIKSTGRLCSLMNKRKLIRSRHLLIVTEQDHFFRC